MKDIIILGMGPTRVHCPWDGAEVWGVNNGFHQVPGYTRAKDLERLKELDALIATQPEDLVDLQAEREGVLRNLASPSSRLDKLFICHKGQEYDAVSDPIFHWGEINALAKSGVELVTLFKIKHLEKQTRMPFRKMVKAFKTDYFSDSIAYMIAYAIYQNTTRWRGHLKLKEPMRMRMYGVDMHTQDEYATEKGGIEYFIAVARTLGVDFYIHPESSVCKTNTGVPYGFFKQDKSFIDPNKVLKLQKSKAGRRKLVEMGLLTSADVVGFEAGVR
jgi:hypothetical protein